MRIWKGISLWKREFIGSTPKVRGGGVGGASGLVLYAAVFVLQQLIEPVNLQATIEAKRE